MSKLKWFLFLWLLVMLFLGLAALLIWGWNLLNQWLDPLLPRWALITVNLVLVSLLVALVIWIDEQD